MASPAERGAVLKGSAGLATAFVLALLAIGVAGGVAAAPNVSQGPVPGWVLPLTPSGEASSEGIDTSDGIHHLLLDVQVNGLIDPFTTYSHRAWRVLGETGVQNGSTIRIPFDPSFERLVLHEVSVLRERARLPRLQLDRVRLIQREERLDAQIYDGTVTALFFIEGVQAGDVVEYSFSLSGLNPTFAGLWAEGFEVGWSVPLVEHHHRISFPASRPMRWRGHGTELAPVVATEGRARVLTWRQSQVDARHVEDGAPGWHDAWPWVQVTEWRTWREVAGWGRELFEPIESLPAELSELAAAWKRETSSEGELARRALRLVQDEVRYLGIEFGPKAYRPSEPGTVYERRFGDCKDKSVLLVQLLRELGLDAQPALVATVTGRGLTERLPSPLLFDHAVVRLRIDDKDYWLDATRLHERGPIERLSVPEWGWALVLSPDADGLVEVEERDFGRTRVDETYECSDYSSPTLFTVHTRFEGSDADAARAMLAGNSREEIQRSYRNYYAGLWAGIEAVRPIAVVDDDVNNRLEVTEVYRIEGFWRDAEFGSVREAEVWSLALDELLLVPNSVTREMPLLVVHPTHFEQRTILRLPEEWSLDAADVRVRDRAFRFDHRARTQADGRIELLHRYETLRSWVEPGRAAEFRLSVEKARETLGLTLTTSAAGAESALRDLEWPLVLLVFFALIAAGAVALLFSARGGGEPGASGLPIGGLLVALTAAIIASPLLGLLSVVAHSEALRRSTWRLLTNPAAPGWHPLVEWERLLGLVGGALLVGLGLLLASRWLSRRRGAPALCLIFLAGAVSLDLGDALLLVAAADEPAGPALEALGRLLVGGLLFALLAAYLRMSGRVRETFVR